MNTLIEREKVETLSSILGLLHFTTISLAEGFSESKLTSWEIKVTQEHDEHLGPFQVKGINAICKG